MTRSLRALVALLVVLLASLSSASTHPPATYGYDGYMDQTAQAPYDLLHGTGLDCHDRAMDVYGTWESRHATKVYVGLQMAQMNGTATCALVPYPVLERTGYVNGTYNATATSGHEFSIRFGVRGETTCVRLTDVATGASGCVPFQRLLVGSFFQWVFDRSGTFTDGNGTTHAYSLDGPVAFWGETWSFGPNVEGVGAPVLYDHFVH